MLILPISLQLYLVVLSYSNSYKCIITGDSTSLGVDTALGRDVTRLPVRIITVLPPPDVGWTLSPVPTADDTKPTYPMLTSTPGAVAVSVQKVVITVPVDWCPLMLLSSGHISAETL